MGPGQSDPIAQGRQGKRGVPGDRASDHTVIRNHEPEAGARPLITYFFSVTVITGDSRGFSGCLVISPIGSSVLVDKT